VSVASWGRGGEPQLASEKQGLSRQG